MLCAAEFGSMGPDTPPKAAHTRARWVAHSGRRSGAGTARGLVAVLGQSRLNGQSRDGAHCQHKWS